jgi:hypothetical protein
MPDYTVKYFGINGRASTLCFMLAHAGADWEKVSIEQGEWPALKPTLGALPVLETGGKVFKEAVPTSRFLARKLGFFSEDPLIAHRIDVIVA